MRKQNIKELGVIDIDKVESYNGRITTIIPIKVIGNELDELLETLYADYIEKHPEVKNPAYSINITYIYGELDSPRFELEVVIWDGSNTETAEFYDEIEINLSEQATKEVKKIIWDALGKSIFNL
ncbi:MAG: hypothetical protein SOY73_00070 [Blautia sp.]|nr:hypothetical protein [Blautia sp.]